MSARAWFTLVVRGIGLWAVVFGAAGLVATLFDRREIGLFSASGSPTRLLTARDARESADELVWLAIGLYLLLGGKLLINRFCAEVVGRCPKCGYDLVGVATGANCPECGTPRE
jgi:hypothetical protein